MCLLAAFLHAGETFDFLMSMLSTNGKQVKFVILENVTGILAKKDMPESNRKVIELRLATLNFRLVHEAVMQTWPTLPQSRPRWYSLWTRATVSDVPRVISMRDIATTMISLCSEALENHEIGKFILPADDDQVRDEDEVRLLEYQAKFANAEPVAAPGRGRKWVFEHKLICELHGPPWLTPVFHAKCCGPCGYKVTLESTSGFYSRLSDRQSPHPCYYIMGGGGGTYLYHS